MIVLDGVVYQALSDGTINIPEDDVTIPFSNVTFFEEDGSVELTDIDSMESLQETLNKAVEENGENMFYMVKVTGDFSYVKARSEYKQEKPYRLLEEALAEDQVEFEFEDVSGTMVGVYCPSYMKDLNSVGWHFHFITEELSKGGHVLSVKIKEAEAYYDVTGGFKMYTPDNEDFQDLDLSRDMEESIKKVETRTNE